MSTTARMTKPVPGSEQLLPAEVTAKSETWLTRARNYPVFSRTWYRYRTQAWLGLFAIIDLLVFSLGWVVDADVRRSISAFVPLTIGGTCLHLLGPGLAVWVRNQVYTSKKEVASLVAALLIGVVCSYGVFQVANYLTKYLVFGGANVEFTFSGSLGSQSKETTVPPVNKQAKPDAGAASQAGSEDQEVNTQGTHEPNPSFRLVMQIISILFEAGVIIYTAGAVDLWYFFRQKKRLLEVLRLQELKTAQEARREAELRLSVLAAQVEPHFLFNTLAGVRSAILTEPHRATTIIDHLVDYLRATIPQMRNDGTSAQGRLRQQLEAATAYLGLMQARIPRLSFSVDSELADAALPPLMLISLVENAVKHGVEPKIGLAHIAVTARKLPQGEDAMLEITVADNGVGFSASSSGSGIGLTNIHERLASMYGKRASLVLKARAEGGVAATILLPLEV